MRQRGRKETWSREEEEEEENRVSKKQVSRRGEKPISGRFVSIMEIVVSHPVVFGCRREKYANTSEIDGVQSRANSVEYKRGQL